MTSGSIAVLSPGVRRVAHGRVRALSLRLLIATTVALFILLPVLGHDGWPYNHDGERPLTRMAIVASHWRMGQLIPVWATSAVMGYGSPSPILYNKTFTYVSAFFYLLVGDGKAALCASLLLFLVVGFLGAAACVRSACGTVNLPLETFAGFMLVSCNYCTTDWLVRGADAEFAAMMLAAWLFAWGSRLLQDGRWSPWLGVLLAVITLTHSIIGLFCLIPVGLAVGLAMVRWRRHAVAWRRPAMVSVAVFAAIILPFALPMAALFGYGRVDFFLAYSPRSSHVSMRRFLWDDEWSWGGEVLVGQSLQLDTGLLISFAALLAMFMWRRGAEARRHPAAAWSATFFVLVVIVMMLLQAQSALIAFDWLPGARYIQFTWRLLAFVSISLVVCAATLLNQLRPARVPGLAVAPGLAVVLGLAIMVSTLANKPWWTGMPRPWFAPSQVAAATHWAHDADPPEYLPRFSGIAAEPWPGWTQATQAVRDLGGRFPYTCQVTPLDGPDWERAKARVSVACPAAGMAALPAFLVRGLRVRANGVAIVAHRSCQDPRARITLPAGTSVVTLYYPTWWSVMRAWWSDPAAPDLPRCGSGEA